MAGSRIKGITIEIGGDTTGLDKALKGTNSEIKSTQSQLKDVEKLLKLDPKNFELLKQKAKLLKQEISETKEKLETLKKAQEQMDANGVDKNSEQYMALQREIISTQNELKNLQTEAGKSNAVLSEVGLAAESVAKGASKVAEATKGISTGAAAILGAAATSSISFEDSFAKVSTLLDKATTDFDAYKDAIIEGSNETGIAAGEFAEAVYSAISAGQDQADAVQFVIDANALAQGGFTSMTSAVDVLTTVMNAYGDSAGTAAEVSDILITTQNEGKTTVDELASSLGAVIPVAAAAGESFSDVGADMAVLTKNGIATSEAGTYLKSMLSELSKTGSDTDVALRELTGKGFAELKEEGVSTAEVLSMLDGYAAQNNLTLKDMFSSTEAGSAALTLYKNEGADLTEELKAMTSATGAASDAFDTVTDTTGHRLSEAFNSLKNTLIELGDVISPIIEKVVEILEGVAAYLSTLDTQTLQTIAIILAVVAAISPIASIIAGIASAISALIPIVSTIQMFCIANPVVLAITAIVAAFAILIAYIVKHWEELKLGWQITLDEINTGIETLKTNIVTAFNVVKTTVSTVFNGIKILMKAIINSLISMVESGINAVINKINAVISAFNSVVSAVARAVGLTYSGISQIRSVKLPKLATGGVVHSGTALVGEAGPELLTVANGNATVTPLTATVDSKSLSNALGKQSIATNVNVTFTGSLAQLAAVLQPAVTAETARRGTSLIKA